MPDTISKYTKSKHTSGVIKSLGLDHSRKFKCFVIYNAEGDYVGQVANWGHQLPFPMLNKLEIGEWHWSLSRKLGYERRN